jgi:tRNA dimethylallyltransferase
LDGKISLDDAIEQIKQNTRRFAKRQLTWFRKDKDIIWVDTSDVNLTENILANIEIMLIKQQ